MYEVNDVYHTVIDFMNEWVGYNIKFVSNLVPIKKVCVDFEYSNDMFLAGHKLYQQNNKCKDLLAKCLPHHQKNFQFQLSLIKLDFPQTDAGPKTLLQALPDPNLEINDDLM